MARATAKSPPLPASYETALHELEQLVTQVEGGELPLDQLLGHYQRGADLLAHCRERLEAVEAQIRLLDGTALSEEEA